MPPFRLANSLNRTITYQSDANDNRTQMTAPGSDVTNYTYYATNQLWTMGPPPSGPSTTFTYDSLHRLSLKTLPTGAKTTPTYDSINQLLNLAHTTSTNQPLLSTDYTYDVLGNRLTRTDGPGMTPLPTTTDPSLWSYDVANRLLTRPGATYTYDNNGNTLTTTDASGTTTYGYDYENRLTSVSGPGGLTVSYAYDPFGRRISKTVNGTITKYLYDGLNILKEYDGAGALLATYTHGPGIDEPVSMTRGGQTYYYHADGLGL
ncbi:MAG: RHS repeat protein [Candidatus Kerfeldbacteria bacterium]|nr:RHS repeat protein [Candidatus Kerfeldbacteria bacterium]